MRKILAYAFVLASLAGIGGCAAAGSAGTTATGKSLTVLEFGATYGSWDSLDPLTDYTASVNYDLLNSIYGELFERGSNGQVIPDLATGFAETSNGRQIKIHLRPGVTFTDGTPFDATAVAFNLRRDLASSAVCICAQNFAAVSGIATEGNDTVVLSLRHQDRTVIHAFFDEAPNWIVSPTALRKLGESKFGSNPVGAGPFKVAADAPGARLVLTANPGYWRRGYPKLANLTFSSANSDTIAYEAMAARQAQVYMNFGTPVLLSQMRAKFHVIATPATQTEAVNLNPGIPPFTSLLAREAIYYATDAAPLDQHIAEGTGVVSQSPGGPGDLFWNRVVPSYRAYDLARAKALVNQLGGLSFTLSVLATPLQETVAEALANQWRAAGIHAALSVITIPRAVTETRNGSLQAITTEVGSYDPALAPGIASYYASTGPFSLVRDASLDRMINAAAAAREQGVADDMYARIYSYLNDRAYAPDLFTIAQWNVADWSVTGLGTTGEVAWQDVTVKP